MRQIFSKIYRLCSDRITADTLFFAGFIPYLLLVMWNTTMFPRFLEGTAVLLYIFACLGLMALKIVVFDRFMTGELIGAGLVVVIGLLTYLGTKDSTCFVVTVCIVAAKDIDFDKIVKVWLTVIISLMILAFTASLLGVIENLQYQSTYFNDEKGIRNSFGIAYATDFAAHVFFIVLSVLYLRRDRFRWTDMLLSLFTTALLYQFTLAKLDSISVLLAAFLFGIGTLVERKGTVNLKRFWSGLWKYLGWLFMPVCAGAMFLLTFFYKEGSSSAIDDMSTVVARFTFGKKGFETWGVKPFGQQIVMYGNGGSEHTNYAKYNFLDCSYVNILIVSGAAMFALVMLIYMIMCIRHREKRYFLYVVALIYVNCMIAHHLLALEYNVFTLGLFAMVGNLNRIREASQ